MTFGSDDGINVENYLILLLLPAEVLLEHGVVEGVQVPGDLLVLLQLGLVRRHRSLIIFKGII